MIFCSCHGSYAASQCTCKKTGVKCYPLCTFCEGGACLIMETEESIHLVIPEDTDEALSTEMTVKLSTKLQFNLFFSNQ